MTETTQLRTILLLLAYMTIPVALSLGFFMHQSLRLDEAQSLWQTSRGFKDVLMIIAGDVHVPLYHLMLRFWRLYIGDGVAFARLLSLVAYLVSIPFFYLLAKEVSHRRVALFATLLFSISPFMNWYGNEVRMYTLFTLLVILNQYFFVRLMNVDRQSDHVWVGYLLSAVAGVFTHYFFLLGLLAQAVTVALYRGLFSRESHRRFVFVGIVTLLALVPWVVTVVRVGTSGFEDPVLTQPSSVDLFNTFSQFLVGFQNDNINRFFLSLWPIVVVLKLFSLRRGERFTPSMTYLLVTVVLSFAVTFLWSMIVSPAFVSRYLIFTIPAFYLLLGSLFETYPPRARRLARGGLVVAMLVMLAVEVVSPTTPLTENYAQAAEYLTEHATAQDVVILSAPFTVYPIQYYYRGAAPFTTLPKWDQYAYGGIPAFNNESLPTEVSAATDVHQRVYVLLSYDQGYEEAIKDYFDQHYQMLSSETFSPNLNLYVYRVRYDTVGSAISNS